MKIQDLKNGDLLFVSSPSDIAEAIQRSTGRYNHVAIFFAGWIYHATSKRGVIKESIDQFLQVDECYAVYACSDIDVKAAWKRAEQHLYKPYNNSFYPDTTGFYCSEYIAEILPIFETIPMQFGDEKEEIAPFWQQYYKELGLAVPLHQPGTNPSQLAQSEKLVYKGRLDD
ncbi:YiiX/YebB-like N1pC/P60 family cysteine hydrolase [Streptococcus anginosus]|uniref:YiiX/YebB-like N1pC/P60 family cysteine hydrolase n=1 Tax=Streptococcus anginosus TaxID=1328 RepID=UPI0021F85BC6|nr:YiiX/YebB-like N1pC/P60 family cysteine hydrolase [Streptococcus anginosus]MCW0990919.1 YiiX/YebB-like N1pC/P60 family cysteine hydrolase [Streptococcus anginosus]